MSDPVSNLEDAIEGLRAAASAKLDLNAILANDEQAPASVTNAMSRARTRDEQAPSLEQGAVGTGRLLRGVVRSALDEVNALRGDFERSCGEIMGDENLSEAGRRRYLDEQRSQFVTRTTAALDNAAEKIRRFSEARLGALARELTPASSDAAPDRLDVLASKLDSLNLTLASANATDAAFEQFARRLIERGDPRAAALLEAGEAQGRDPLLLQRLAAAARATGASEARSAAERWLSDSPGRLVNAAELKWIRELKRQAEFVIDALKRNPAERPILPSHFEII